VGQSSWGPTLYAFAQDEESADALAARIEDRFGLAHAGEVIVTAADNEGCTVRETAHPPRRAGPRSRSRPGSPGVDPDCGLQTDC